MIMGYMVLVTVMLSVLLGVPDDETGFTPLFDGKTLSGWKQLDSRGGGYVVEDGAIVCPQGGGGKLFTEKEYANFVFRFEFRLTPGANNGIGIRAPLDGDAAYAGMEIQVLDNEHPKYANLKPAQYHGSVYHIFPAKRGFLKPTGEWNVEEIVADGPNIKVTLNGEVITQGNLAEVNDPAILAKHPGIKRERGHLGFLGHGDRVEFRNIRIKEL
jgi:hypothetical protein